MVKLNMLVATILLLGACTTSHPTMVFPSSCADNDAVCERNLNARTLSEIGFKKAATRLMCKDPDVSAAMGDACTE